MTSKKRERINELEKELAPMLKDAKGFDEKYRTIKETVSAFVSGRLCEELDSEDFATLCEYESKILELGRLYDELVYEPDEDEKTLSYLFCDGMSIEDKLKALADAWWSVTSSGYSDAMANRLMAGEEDVQTQRWEQNCKNIVAIDRYYKWLKDQSEN